MTLATADDLLAGAGEEHVVEVPYEIRRPLDVGGEAPDPLEVHVRALTLGDVHRIAKASKGDEALAGAMMIERALVQPHLERSQIQQLPSGLVRFLIDVINRSSGLVATNDEVRTAAESPLGRLFFALAKEFGWSAQDVRELTVGEALTYLQAIRSGTEELPS